MPQPNVEKHTGGSSLKPAIALIKVLMVVVGVVVSVLSFNNTRNVEAKKPFLELRQKYYLEAVKVAAILATPDGRTEDDLKKAKQRFAELYWSELGLVESKEVETAMIHLAGVVYPQLVRDPTDAQDKALKLAHTLRDSLVESWGVPTVVVDNPHQ